MKIELKQVLKNTPEEKLIQNDFPHLMSVINRNYWLIVEHEYDEYTDCVCLTYSIGQRILPWFPKWLLPIRFTYKNNQTQFNTEDQAISVLIKYLTRKNNTNHVTT